MCSMISGQCDKLRLIADKDTVPYEASDAMYQAADTILELRDDLQRANAENAKLRELCSALYKFAYDEYPDSAELNFADRLRELGVEVE